MLLPVLGASTHKSPEFVVDSVRHGLVLGPTLVARSTLLTQCYLCSAILVLGSVVLE